MASHEQTLNPNIDQFTQQQQERFDQIASRTEQVQDALEKMNEDQRKRVRGRAVNIVAGLADPNTQNDSVVGFDKNQTLSDEEVLGRKIAGNYLDAVALDTEVGNGLTDQEVRFALPFNASEGKQAPVVLHRNPDETDQDYDKRLITHVESHRDRLLAGVDALEKVELEGAESEAQKADQGKDLGLLGKSPEEALATLRAAESQVGSVDLDEVKEMSTQDRLKKAEQARSLSDSVNNFYKGFNQSEQAQEPQPMLSQPEQPDRIEAPQEHQIEAGDTSSVEPIKLGLTGEAAQAYTNSQRTRNLREEYAKTQDRTTVVSEEFARTAMDASKGPINLRERNDEESRVVEPSVADSEPAPAPPEEAPTLEQAVANETNEDVKVNLFGRAKQLVGKFARQGFFDKLNFSEKNKVRRAVVAAMGVATVSLALAPAAGGGTALVDTERAGLVSNTPAAVEGSSGGPGVETFKRIELNVDEGGGVTDAIKTQAEKMGINATPEQLKAAYDSLVDKDAIGEQNTYRMEDGSIGVADSSQPILINEALLNEQIDDLADQDKAL